jgi:hypothetical protein
MGHFKFGELQEPLELDNLQPSLGQYTMFFIGDLRRFND